MKNSFHPDEFVALLDSLGQLVMVLINSRQYQDMTFCEEFQHLGFDLVDAHEAIEGVADLFEKLNAVKSCQNQNITPQPKFLN